MTERRRPWVAALLSLVLPGLGHLYAGYPLGAVLAYGAALGGVALMLVMWFLVPGGPLTIFLGLAASIVIYLGIAVHAGVLAARQPATFALRPYNRWYVYLAVYALLGLVVSPALQGKVKQDWEAFRIPSEAMAPTLLIGDYLYVLKTEAAREHLTHGSVVVFESVEEPGLKVIKRVIGLPGDTVSMAAGTLRRNGQVLDEPFAVHHDSARSEDPEQRAKMRAWQVGHTIGIDNSTYAPDVQTWGPLVVSPDSFFALGDNRDASYDSRYYGFVPLSRVLGQPDVIYWSLDRDTSGTTKGVRWSRLGSRVR